MTCEMLIVWIAVIALFKGSHYNVLTTSYIITVPPNDVKLPNSNFKIAETSISPSGDDLFAQNRTYNLVLWSDINLPALRH